MKWSKTNKRSYKRDCQLVDNLRRWFGGRKLSAISPGDIETFKIERKTERARSWSQRFISNATVNREVACLKRMFNLAIEWSDAHRNPVKNIKMLQEAKKQERYIDGDEFSKLYEAASPTIRPVLLLAYHTGMRSSEFLNLQWRQVKIFDPPLRMVGNIQNYGYIQLVRTKSGKVREIPLNHTIWDYLTKQNRNDPDDYVLRASHGGRFRSIKDQFKNTLKRAGLRPARIHDLRGSWATRMNENGVDAYTIMEIGGWSSLSVLQRYLKRNQRKTIQAMQTLDSAPHTRHMSAKLEDPQIKKAI